MTAKQSLVPQGWVLVPTKHEGRAGLTHEMWAAFWAAYGRAEQKHGNYEATNAGYNALLAASPAPPSLERSHEAEAV